MINIENKNWFIENYFGDNYMKKLSMENDVKLSSLYRNIIEEKDNITKNINNSGHTNNDIIEIINNSFNNILNLPEKGKPSQIDSIILQDIKEYNLPIMKIADTIHEFNNKKSNKNTRIYEISRKEAISCIVIDVIRNFNKNTNDFEALPIIFKILNYIGLYHIDFFGSYISLIAKRDKMGISDVLEKIDDKAPSGYNRENDYQNFTEKLKKSGFETTYETLAQLDAYIAYCKGNTGISSAKSDLEAILMITNKISSISSLHLSDDLDCETFDDSIEAQRLGEGLAMIFDYTSSKKCDILNTMVEFVENNNKA